MAGPTLLKLVRLEPTCTEYGTPLNPFQFRMRFVPLRVKVTLSVGSVTRPAAPEGSKRTAMASEQANSRAKGNSLDFITAFLHAQHEATNGILIHQELVGYGKEYS